MCVIYLSDLIDLIRFISRDIHFPTNYVALSFFTIKKKIEVAFYSSRLIHVFVHLTNNYTIFSLSRNFDKHLEWEGYLPVPRPYRSDQGKEGQRRRQLQCVSAERESSRYPGALGITTA